MMLALPDWGVPDRLLDVGVDMAGSSGGRKEVGEGRAGQGRLWREGRPLSDDNLSLSEEKDRMCFLRCCWRTETEKRRGRRAGEAGKGIVGRGVVTTVVPAGEVMSGHLAGACCCHCVTRTVTPKSRPPPRARAAAARAALDFRPHRPPLGPARPPPLPRLPIPDRTPLTSSTSRDPSRALLPAHPAASRTSARARDLD
jgi:hypothetical protein